MTTTFISTTAGNSIVNGDSRVYMRISGDTYVREKGKNLQRGDMIVYEKQFVDKELGEVEDYLMSEDPRYVRAKGGLFEQNSNGIYVPRLRTGIWRAAPNDIKAYPDFDGRVLMEGSSDFEPDDYREMTGVVQEALEIDYQNGGPEPVTGSAVRGWLKDTVAPADWRMFRALTRINQDFNQFYGDFIAGNQVPSLDNLFAAYGLFVGIRRGIMNYIAARKGLGRGSGGVNGDERTPTPRHPGRYSLQPEIDIIMRHVMQEVDDQRIVVAVTGVKNTPGPYTGPRTSPQQKLSSGVVTGRENKPDNAVVKKWDEIDNELSVLAKYLDTAFHTYTEKRFRENGIVDENEKRYVINRIAFRSRERNRRNRPTVVKLQTDFLSREKQEISEERTIILDGMAETLYQEVSQGPSHVNNPDKRYIFPRILEGLVQLEQKIPHEYSEYDDLEVRKSFGLVPKSQMKIIERRMDELRGRIIGEHGFDPKVEPKKQFRCVYNDRFKEAAAMESVVFNINPIEWETTMGEQMAKHGIEFFTPEEETEVVRQYGCEDLLDLSWI